MAEAELCGQTELEVDYLINFGFIWISKKGDSYRFRSRIEFILDKLLTAVIRKIETTMDDHMGAPKFLDQELYVLKNDKYVYSSSRLVLTFFDL